MFSNTKYTDRYIHKYIDPTRTNNNALKRSRVNYVMAILIIIIALILGIAILFGIICMKKHQKLRKIIQETKTELARMQSQSVTSSISPATTTLATTNNINNKKPTDTGVAIDDDSLSDDNMYAPVPKTTQFGGIINDGIVTPYNNRPKPMSTEGFIDQLSINDNDKDYKKWNASQLIAWIINLDPKRFSKYNQILQKHLTSNNINGSNIQDISKTDLLSFGIHNFKDRSDIFKSLKKLMDITHNDVMTQGNV